MLLRSSEIKPLFIDLTPHQRSRVGPVFTNGSPAAWLACPPFLLLSSKPNPQKHHTSFGVTPTSQPVALVCISVCVLSLLRRASARNAERAPACDAHNATTALSVGATRWSSKPRFTCERIPLLSQDGECSKIPCHETYTRTHTFPHHLHMSTQRSTHTVFIH